MSQLDHVNSGNSHTEDTFSDKLHREASLLASVPDNAWSGLKARAADAWDHKMETGAEMVGSVALGVGLAMALRNPETALYARFAPWAGGAVMGVDVAKRVGAPMLETLNDPLSLARNKARLGANLGAMTFDYALMGAFGAAGADFGPALVDEAVTVSGLKAFPESVHLDGLRGAPPVKFEPVSLGGPKSMPTLENLGTSDMPALKMRWPEGIGAADKLRISGEAADRLFANAAANVNFTTLIAMTRYGFPLGTQMGMGVAAASDLIRPRANTKLGALTEMKPQEANSKEALGRFFSKGLDFNESIETYTIKHPVEFQTYLKETTGK